MEGPWVGPSISSSGKETTLETPQVQEVQHEFPVSKKKQSKILRGIGSLPKRLGKLVVATGKQIKYAGNEVKAGWQSVKVFDDTTKTTV